jgi:ribonuclease VapC
LAGAKVLDSWGLLCYLEREPGFEKVIDLFDAATKASRPLLMCVVNWGEVCYQVARRAGEGKAQEMERLIRTFPVQLVDADRDLTREAARLKAANRMAYADCFAAALAKQQKAELVTGDQEFRQVEGKVQIVWI